MPGTFTTTVVTPERQVAEAQCTYANLPAHDGQLGVQHNRAPLLVELGEGTLRLDLAAGGTETYRLRGGFAQVVDNKLTVLADAVDSD